MTSSQQQPVSYATPSAPKAPLYQRINVRMLVLAVVVLALVGTPVYIYLDTLLSGGIHAKGDRVEVDLKSMSNFPFDQVNGSITDIPQQWRDLDGKRIEVQGELYAKDSASNEISRFDVVYSIAKCCFSGPPQVQHFVHSQVKGGGTVPYYSGLVTVVGVLHVNVKKAEGKISQVYSMDVESVQQM